MTPVGAVILAGGEGRRMRPLTNTIPKSLLPVCNRPFLEHQVRWLGRHGVAGALLLTGYLPAAFDEFSARSARDLGVALGVAREEAPLGTAGAVRNVFERLAFPALVFNGDVLTDLDLGALVAFHRERGAVLTIALTPVADAGPYGLVPLGAEGRVEAFLEKPPPDVAAEGGLINAGTYVIDPGVLDAVPPGRMWSFERQVFPALLERGARVYGFPSDAYWIDIGTPERYLQAHRDALDGRITIEMDGALRDGPALIGPGASVERDARIGPHAVLGPRCSLGGRAAVERSVLLEGARVDDRAVVRDSILGPGATVPPDGSVSGAVLGEGERAG